MSTAYLCESSGPSVYNRVMKTVYYGMDCLVSWNCTHITAGRVRMIVEAINDERGYQTPIICTPEELMEV